jgi:hypothetical protein
LPLAILFILKYLDTKRRRYLAYLFLALVYVFYASWYQMVFTLMALGFVLLGQLWIKKTNFKALCICGLVVVAAVVATLTLAKEYLRFSKESGAEYTMEEKIINSSSVTDYFVPTPVTLSGKAFMASGHGFGANTWSYPGISLYILVIVGGLWLIVRQRKKIAAAFVKLYVAFMAIGFVTFIISLGPVLRYKGHHLYNVIGHEVVIPLPYVLIDKLPMLGFMRQPARATMLVTFALCCLLALLAIPLAKEAFYKKHRFLINSGIVLLLIIDLLPLSLVSLDPHPHAYHPEVPKVYQYIKKNPEIDNIIILQAKEYPNVSFWFARTENVLWAGYHNRNIFNGYSGYIPPTYEADYSDFVNLDADDPAQMKHFGLRYVIVDSELYTNKPEVLKKVPEILGDRPLYSDDRYKLYKLE